MSEVTVAVDLLGGDDAPEVVLAGAALARSADPELEVLFVGPPAMAEGHPVAAASQVVGMDEDPARAVRAKRDATVRIAARLVRDGQAHAMVSIGSTGAALAAAIFTLGRLPGITRPALAVVVPAPGGPLVLLDTGASTEATADQLAQFALTGAAYARVALDIGEPRVGLLTIAEEPGKGDLLRRQAWPLLASLDRQVGGPVRFVGSVEGHDVPRGGVADVVVTDGFTGNVLLKGIEGTVQALAPAADVARRWGADGVGGGVLLGVPGVVIVGHGSSSPAAVAVCIAQAAAAVRGSLVGDLTQAVSGLVAARRRLAGLAGSSA